jgi:hypothetical protein
MSWRKEPSIDTMSMTWSAVTLASSRFAIMKAYSAAERECSEPSIPTRTCLIMGLARVGC